LNDVIKQAATKRKKASDTRALADTKTNVAEVVAKEAGTSSSWASRTNESTSASRAYRSCQSDRGLPNAG
jgi:hypothetical protein